MRDYEVAPEGASGGGGGMGKCDYCKCYVQSDNELSEKADEEEAMLSEAFNVKENSRLGCQLHISDVMDGLEVELAPAE